MSGQQKVTVMLTTFNQREYIAQALDSILCQKTSFPFEVLVHDDASQDGTADIIREYAKRHPDLLKPILQTENQYSRQVDIVRSILLPKVRGEYIAFLEGDDYWCDPEKLEKQVRILTDRPDCSACAHNTKRLDCETGVLTPLFASESRDLLVKDVCIQGAQSFHTSSLLMRTQALRHPPFDFAYVLFGDFTIAMQLALAGPIYYLNEVMSVYRYQAKGAFSQRHRKPEDLARVWERGALMLSTALAATQDPAQREAILGGIAFQNFQRLECLSDYQAMRQEPYRAILKKKPLPYRMRAGFIARFPRLYERIHQRNLRKLSEGNPQ